MKSIATVLLFTLLLTASLTTMAQRTIMLTEKEYLALQDKAKEPACPASSDLKGEAKSGFTLQLGGGIQYLYGSDNGDNQDFDGDLLDWYGTGMIGYVFNDDKRGPGTSLGVFATGGNTNATALTRLLNQGQTNRKAQVGTSENRFYQLEAGMVILETLRLSSGVGLQDFTDQNGSDQRLNYYSTTLGLRLGSENIKLTLDLHTMYGRDLGETLFRPSCGLLLRL